MSRKYLLDCSASGAKWADDVHLANSVRLHGIDHLFGCEQAVQSSSVSDNMGFILPILRSLFYLYSDRRVYHQAGSGLHPIR